MFAKTTNVGFAQRVVATLVACALVLWSVGAYTTAQAANLTTISDTLSDSDVSVVSNHTITFSSPTGVANGATIDLDFSDGPFVLGSVDFSDVDVSIDGLGDMVLVAACGGAGDEVGVDVASWPVMTLELCTGEAGVIGAGGTTTIEIGTNATAGVAGDAQLTNPTAGSYEIVITAGASDTGRLRVAIIDNVLVSAVVQTSFDFTITGHATGTAINGTSTTGSTTPTAINFGVLTADEIKSLAQRLSVTTNARNGFVVTVQSDSDLESSTGADIDVFDEGSDVSVPTAWNPPVPTIGNENSWGHWGVTSDDTDLAAPFGANEFIAISSTTPRQLFTHDGPADGSTDDIGQADVLYQVVITSLQEAADDYSTVLTYVATPTF